MKTIAISVSTVLMVMASVAHGDSNQNVEACRNGRLTAEARRIYSLAIDNVLIRDVANSGFPRSQWRQKSAKLQQLLNSRGKLPSATNVAVWNHGNDYFVDQSINLFIQSEMNYQMPFWTSHSFARNCNTLGCYKGGYITAVERKYCSR